MSHREQQSERDCCTFLHIEHTDSLLEIFVLLLFICVEAYCFVFIFQILIMDDQSYFELLHSDAGLNDLHWTKEEQMDLEKDEE